MADLEQLILSVSADTRQMQKALAKLTGDTQKTAKDVDAAFGKAPPQIDNVAKYPITASPSPSLDELLAA